MKQSITKTMAVVALAFGIAAPASAATVVTVSGTAITVSCSGPLASSECNGFIGGSLTFNASNPDKDNVNGGTAGSLSTTAADLYALKKSNPAQEGAAIDVLLDGSLDGDITGGVQTQVAAADDAYLQFNSSAQYLAVKTGNPVGTDQKWFFLKLFGPGPITLIYDKNGQSGGGFSHYTEFGSIPDMPTIPLPAAGWMLIAGLGGLGVIRRRKKSA
ncbi:VPLPA-CTERM sorting domain-containing protein [Maliponia aquimaris]|uniref:VPLPA-CTERM protein sorting domain protein n=1 Tax=Maliponia aquimaris TaxID=1673631 RepID=A0A238JZM1_9RHOB|nr:VPLPA-CTERM sorting domain-containing protein [Maliponia aquimaris]SMX35953.1 hypothetical protein MAA8898_00702 [Maliponia aquimaris]